jgi:hypothetical protein
MCDLMCILPWFISPSLQLVRGGSKVGILAIHVYRYLALMAALASEADWVFIPEWPPEKGWEDTLCNKLAQVDEHF